MISLFNAPIDLRIHISRVLSETDTSIIFITQIHHTISDIAAIHHKNALSVHVTLVIVDNVSAELVIEKFALLASGILNLFNRYFVKFSFVPLIASALTTVSPICDKYLVPNTLFWAVVIGMKIELSALLNPFHPLDSITHTTVKKVFPIRIFWPRGFAQLNKFVTTSVHIAAFAVQFFTSSSVMKSPYWTFELRTDKYEGVTPYKLILILFAP
jgi:hypothetical protein